MDLLTKNNKIKSHRIYIFPLLMTMKPFIFESNQFKSSFCVYLFGLETLAS